MSLIIPKIFLNKTIFKIRKFLKKETKINKKMVLGRAWIEQDPISISAYAISAFFNFNNIIMQSRSIDLYSKDEIKYSGTFNTSRFFEKEIVKEVSRLLKWKDKEVSGYVTSGGTESNIYAMWIARNIFNLNDNEKNFWLIPATTHYSVWKGLDILGVLNDSRNIVENFPIKKEIFKVDIDFLARKAADNSKNSNVFVVLTLMTTQYGIVDDINLFLKIFYECSGVIKNLYLHIDACYGGTVLPILCPENANLIPKEVFSLSVDFHKITGGPIGSGMVILKSYFEDFTKSDIVNKKASYIKDGWDYTLSGSRNGINAIQLWALFEKLSKDNYSLYKKKINKSCENAKLLADNINKIKGFCVPVEPIANQFFFIIENTWENKRKEIEEFLYKYSITGHEEIFDVNEKLIIYKVIVNYNHPKKVLRNFLKELNIWH